MTRCPGQDGQQVTHCLSCAWPLQANNLKETCCPHMKLLALLLEAYELAGYEVSKGEPYCELQGHIKSAIRAYKRQLRY